ncbi:MAG: hypothetical protein KIS92_19310, partial [Planctomycetota bacterium]|nr:hypothetical protein [Planctomycetota bacterium]
STARIEDALKIGGPLLRRFVAALPEDWRDPDADVVVSVKRNELAPGWSPAPVGWHIDGTHTADRHPDGRANLRNPGNTVEQILCCCGPAAPTRFLLGEIELPEPPLGSKQGQRWQRELEAAADAGRMQRWNAPIDTLVAFGFGDFHTGATADVRGWRCFIKAMRGRGQLTHGGPVERSPVSWPADQPGLPEDPCGIFPDVLP